MTDSNFLILNKSITQKINDLYRFTPNNYVLSGSINDICYTSKSQIYFLILDKRRNTDIQLKIYTEIVSDIIKFLKETIGDLEINKIYYIKYIDSVCKFTILDKIEMVSSFELLLKHNLI
jgi:hypothetical protein